jgi:hypothetical protein
MFHVTMPGLDALISDARASYARRTFAMINLSSCMIELCRDDVRFICYGVLREAFCRVSALPQGKEEVYDGAAGVHQMCKA